MDNHETTLSYEEESKWKNSSTENIEHYIFDFQKLAKTFSYIRECNNVCIGREEEKK